MKGDYVVRSGAGTANALIDANSEALVCTVEDLEHVVIQLVQVTDNGTVVLVTEASTDGTYWATVDASTAETDFAAGAGTVVEFSLSDSNAMPKAYKQVRVRATTYTGTGTYALRVSGHATK